MATLTRDANFIPVVITDSDGPHDVYAGGTYTCLPCPPSASTVTFNYASGNQYKSFHRIGFVGSVTAAALTNVTSYTIYKNGVLITPLVFPVALAQNDRLYVSIVPTNAALAASIELAVTGITSAVAFNSLSYYYPRNMVFKEGVVELTDMMLHSDVAIKGLGTIGSHRGNVIYGDPVAGEWDMIYVPAQWNFTGRFNVGMNDRSTSDTPPNILTRVRYCISLNANGFEVFEFNVNKVIVGVLYNQLFHLLIRSRMTAPGVYTVTYHYSNDNQATWTLVYTSLSTHDGTVNFYPDVMPTDVWYAEIKPPILKKP